MSTTPRTTIGSAFPRLGLLGNPGDGYGGRALATLFYDFRADVTVRSSPDFRLHPNPKDGLRFDGLGDAVASFSGGGCEDGLRLIRAAVKRFPEVAGDSGWDLGGRWQDEGVQVSYETNVPRQVGLSGSSALIIATFRALAAYFGFELDRWAMAESALRAETEDLGIAAGPMDRIVQAWEETVHMDLAPPRSAEKVQTVDTGTLPPLYLAWSSTRTKSSGRLHGPLRQRWEEGDREVLDVVDQLRDLVQEGLTALEEGDTRAFGRCMSRNFRLRCRIFPVHEEDRAMAALAEELGCPTKLAGSGGGLVGMIGEGVSVSALEEAARSLGFAFLIPTLTPPPPATSPRSGARPTTGPARPLPPR